MIVSITHEKRNLYLDNLRAIAIILVIIGHTPYPTFSPAPHKWVYAFHIPLFFFISGMALSFQNYSKNTPKQILVKRFRRIYLPYSLWGILLAIPNFSLMTTLKILYDTHKSIASVTNSSLWFLPVLFLSLVLLNFILICFKKISKNTVHSRIIPFFSNCRTQSNYYPGSFIRA